MLPTTDCPNLVSEVFLNGNEPIQPDNMYRRYAINRETGLLALLRNKHNDILEAIRTSRDLDDATAGKLKSVVDGYAKTFA